MITIPTIADLPPSQTSASTIATGTLTLVGMSPSELEALMARWGEPRFRARQIGRWLFRDDVFDPRAMRDLPLRLRERLAAEMAPFPLDGAVERSADAGLTAKALLRLAD